MWVSNIRSIPDIFLPSCLVLTYLMEKTVIADILRGGVWGGAMPLATWSPSAMHTTVTCSPSRADDLWMYLKPLKTTCVVSTIESANSWIVVQVGMLSQWNSASSSVQRSSTPDSHLIPFWMESISSWAMLRT